MHSQGMYFVYFFLLSSSLFWQESGDWVTAHRSCSGQLIKCPKWTENCIMMRERLKQLTHRLVHTIMAGVMNGGKNEKSEMTEEARKRWRVHESWMTVYQNRFKPKLGFKYKLYSSLSVCVCIFHVPSSGALQFIFLFSFSSSSLPLTLIVSLFLATHHLPWILLLLIRSLTTLTPHLMK